MFFFRLPRKTVIPRTVPRFSSLSTQNQDLEKLAVSRDSFMLSVSCTRNHGSARIHEPASHRLTLDLWLAKDNRFLNPKSSYGRILTAPPCRLITRSINRPTEVLQRHMSFNKRNVITYQIPRFTSWDSLRFQPANKRPRACWIHLMSFLSLHLQLQVGIDFQSFIHFSKD